MRSHLSVTVDTGILILGCIDDFSNEAYFMDFKDYKMKKSEFNHSVGPINNWKNSFKFYEQRFNFLTEQVQVLRFEN